MRKSKYNNKKTEWAGMTFDSAKEAKRAQELHMMQNAKLIKNLMMQVPFMLAPAVVINGRKKPALRYVADFVYMQDGQQIINDVKGCPLTQVYIIKRHLMKSVHNYCILET